MCVCVYIYIYITCSSLFVRYEFTAGDLKCCILQLETYLAKYDEVPYQVSEKRIDR